MEQQHAGDGGSLGGGVGDDRLPVAAGAAAPDDALGATDGGECAVGS